MDSQDAGQETHKREYLGTEKHMRRGLSLFKKGDYQRAIEQFDLILLHDKNYVRAYNNLGYIYRTIGNYQKALEIWEEGLKIDTSYKRLHENISGLRRFLKSKQEKTARLPIGIEDFQAGVEWLSDNAELVEIREGRFFDAYVIEDDDTRYVFKTPGEPLSRAHRILEAFERASLGWLRLSPNEHVVKAHSLEQISGKPFLALEYAPEGSLRDLLNLSLTLGIAFNGERMTRGATDGSVRLPLPQVLDFALQICLGMLAIEVELGAHGDLRLENILLTKAANGGGQAEPISYVVKITDMAQRKIFGRQELFCNSQGEVVPELAEKGLFKTPGGLLTASLYSCAPELLETHRRPNVSTDVYAFGITFYEMLTGSPPFSGLGLNEIIQELAGKNVERPSKIRKSTPPLIDAICTRCLERDPGARYKDFSEIAEDIIKCTEAMKSALAELNGLCRRYKKVSRFQFRDGETGTSMMIVGGTEFSTEIDQVLNLLKRRTQKEHDEVMEKRLEHIENVLVVPGISIGEIYPAPADVAEILVHLDLEKYRHEMSRSPCSQKGDYRRAAGVSDVSTASTVESPADKVGTADTPQGEVFGSSIAQRYSSLLGQGRINGAARLLADALEFRALTLLSESSKGWDLLTTFKETTRSDLFCVWLSELFRELPASHSIPGPEDFLQNGMNTSAGVIAEISGFLLMLAGEFAAALEAFNMMPGEQYLPALDIYVWAMARFQPERMEKLRLNSLKNADRLLKEAIIGDKEPDERSSALSPLHGAGLRDALLLRSLVLEHLGEHRRAIAHIQAYKKVFDSDPNLSREKLPWAHVILGKCMYNSGLPSESLMRWQRVLLRELTPPFFAFLELGSAKPLALLATYMLQSCEKAIFQFGDRAVLWSIKGKLLNCLGLSQDAFECVHRALETDEDFYPAYYIRMEALTSVGQYEEGLKALRVCSVREPHNPLLMLRESEMLCRMGEPEKALGALKRAIGHGLDFFELRSSIEKQRLVSLRKIDEFTAIMADLGRV